MGSVQAGLREEEEAVWVGVWRTVRRVERRRFCPEKQKFAKKAKHFLSLFRNDNVETPIGVPCLFSQKRLRKRFAFFAGSGRAKVGFCFCPSDRLPRERALTGIPDREAANRTLAQSYQAAFHAEFLQPVMEEGSVFVEWIGGPSRKRMAGFGLPF